MSLLSVPAIVMASLVFYVGIYHLLIFFRRPRHNVDLTFALTCLAVGLYDIFCAGLYGATSVEEGVYWQRLQIIGIGLASTALLWFVADYTSQQQKKITVVLSLCYLLLIAVTAVERIGLIWTDEPLVKAVRLPFGIEFNYYEMAPGPVTNIFSLVGLIVFVYICWMGIRLYSSGKKSKALPLLLAMAIFFLGVFNDSAIASGLYASIYLIEYSYLALVLLMAYSLSNELVASGKVKIALQESERRFRTLVEQAADGFFLHDTNGKIIDVNRRVSESTGFSRAELLAMSVSEVKRLFFNQEFDVINWQSSSRKKHMTLEGIHTRKDGSTFPVEVRLSSLVVGDDFLILALARDITKRKQANQELRESERKYRQLANSLPQVVFEMNHDGLVTFVNRNAINFFGYSQSDFDKGINALDLLDDRDRDRARENMQKRLSGQELGRLEYTAKRKDGSTFPVVIHVNPVFEGDTPAGLRGILIDISDRKQAEAALKKSEKRYRTLFEKSTDAIFVVDRGHGRYLDANQAAVELTGRPLPELKQLTTRDLSSAGAGARLEKIRESHTAAELGKTTYVRPDGTQRIARLNSVPLDDEAVIGIARDITDELAMEALLRQSQKMEAIGTLAGGIAHDFNNILSAVIGYTELALNEAPRDTALYENLQEVFRASGRARDLVKQILTFSRQTEQEQKPVQVKLICLEAIKFLRASLPTSITIRHEIMSASLVMADPTQIHQVLMNLCTNASHAMGDSGGVLTVELKDLDRVPDLPAGHPELRAGPYIELTVSDTGHGIPAHLIERIFDPFFTTKEKGKGTGMGLAVVHGIIGSCGGAITLSSEPGKGTTFNIYLPAVKRDSAPVSISEAPLETGTERILLVDDETALVKIGKQMLESLNYRVTTRTSSIEALELFKARADHFDLVISDMTMPNMTGDKLAREMMRIRPEIPVILCTGYSTHINQEQAMAMGIRAFVSKPILRRDIARVIRKVLSE